MKFEDNLSVQVTARAEPLWQIVENLNYILFIEVSGSLGCP
jgi:hypothetical protein